MSVRAAFPSPVEFFLYFIYIMVTAPGGCQASSGWLGSFVILACVLLNFEDFYNVLYCFR
jgi:hypothetical protein